MYNNYYNPPVTETRTVEVCEYDKDGNLTKKTVTTTTETRQSRGTYTPYWYGGGYVNTTANQNLLASCSAS